MTKRYLVLLVILNILLPITLIGNSPGSTSQETAYSNFETSSILVEKIFHAPEEQMFYYSSPALDEEGNIYIGSGHKGGWFEQGGTWSDHYFMYSFEPGPDFDLRWKFDVGPNIVTGGPVIHPKGLIFFVAHGYNSTTGEWPINSSLYALNSDGSLNWSSPINTDIEYVEEWRLEPNYPTLDNMGNVYVHGENHYYSFHWNNGTIRWMKINTGHPGSPSVYNDTVHFAGRGQLSAYYVNGTSKWNFTSNNWLKHKLSLGLDGTIYFASERNNLTAVNPNGTLKWSLTITDGQVRGNPAIDRDGTIFIGTHNHDHSELFAIYPNGSIKWRKTPFYDLYSSPALGSDGRLYIASEKQGGDYDYYFINKTNGHVDRHLSLEYDVTWSSSVIGNGYIFIGDMGGYLYAIHVEGLELSNAPWPCMGGNPQRTGIGDDLRPPTITIVEHTPSIPAYEDEITLYADVVDASGIQSVNCSYRVNSGTWSSKTMDRIQSDTYQASIGNYNIGDEIDYYVEAYDSSVNMNYYKNDNSSEYYRIIVGLESATTTTSSITIATTTSGTSTTTTTTTEPTLPDPSMYVLIGSAIAVCCIIIILRLRKK